MKKHVASIFYANPDGYPPIINSTRLLCQAGHTVDIFCRKYGSALPVQYPAQAQITRFQSKQANSLGAYLAFVRNVLRHARPTTDVVFGHDMHGFLPALLVAKWYKKPLFYHCHDFVKDEPATIGGKFVWQFQKYFVNSSEVVIVPDKDRASVMRSTLGLKKPSIIVANAPLRQPIRPRSDILLALLHQQGKNFDKIILRQGSLGPSHALENTIRSIPSWDQPNVGFVMLGPGKADYLQSLENLAVSLGVNHHIAILPPVGYDQVLNYTVNADIGHALYEPVDVNWQNIATASNKIMEYIASAIPVLASNRSDIKDLFDLYQCGLTCDESHPKSIADAINILLANSSLRDEMGRNGRNIFETEFNYEKSFAMILDKIISC